MTTSMPIQAPAEAMCATRKILRVRAPNRHGRTPPPRAKGVMTLPYLDVGPPWKPSRIEFRTITLIVAKHEERCSWYPHLYDFPGCRS